MLVPEAEAVVGRWRLAHTPSGAAGMPAHLTLLYPFAPAEEVDVVAVREVAAGIEAFSFALTAVREWPDGVLLYLEPEPSEPFGRLTKRLVERFPAYPLYGRPHDPVVPHLTVAILEDGAARADAAASVAIVLPIDCSASEIWLMHEVNGRWQRHTPFSLGH